MSQVTERVKGYYEVQDVPPGEVGRWSWGHVVLERGWDEGSAQDESLEEERPYSWLEDYLERLEGKEARHDYYARLERAVPL